MHELGIAIDVVDLASETAARLGQVQVIAVRLRIGALAGVARDALLFSFDAASAGTPLEGARLQIEEVPARVWCPTCRAERELADPALRRCPECLAPAPNLVRGDEVQLVGLEVRDP